MTDAEAVAQLHALIVIKDGEECPAYSPESLHWDAEDIILAVLEQRGAHDVATAFRHLRNTPHCFWYA